MKDWLLPLGAGGAGLAAACCLTPFPGCFRSSESAALSGLCIETRCCFRSWPGFSFLRGTRYGDADEQSSSSIHDHLPGMRTFRPRDDADRRLPVVL